MLAPGVGAARRLRLAADAADDLAVVPGLVDADRRSSTATFVGLDNFRDIFDDLGRPRLQGARCVNTALYTVMSVALILPLSVAFGLLVHQKLASPAARCCRTVLFSTYMVPMIAVALVWSKLYSPTEGPLNQILGWVGIGPQPWLSSPQHRAGLDRAAQRLAAGRLFHRAGGRRADADPGHRSTRRRRIDGANALAAVLRRSRCRCCGSTLLFIAVIAIINAVQVFEPVALITQGGPVGSTNVLTYHIRRVGIERAQGGLGSAMAVTLMLALIVAICAAVRLRATAEGRRMSAPPSPATVAHRAAAPAAARRPARCWRSLMLLVAVVAAFPLVWMVLTSLKTTAGDHAGAAGLVPAHARASTPMSKVAGVVECRPLVVQLGGHRLGHHGRHHRAPA